MSKLSQKDAVYNAVTQVLTNNNVTYCGDVNPHMNRTLRAQVNEILFAAFRSGSISLDREFTDGELKTYVSGLQSNWIRKDSRLNGTHTKIDKIVDEVKRQDPWDPNF